MSKIVDPDSLTVIIDGSPTTQEVSIDTGAKTIELRVAGNLDDASPGSLSGVTLQAVYSFLKEEWKTQSDLNKFKFPIKMYTKTDGTMQNEWNWANAQTRQLIRDGGWTEIILAGDSAGDQYAGIISLGSFDESTDQAYYQQVSGFSASTTNFDKTGNLNEAIKIFDGSGTPDYTDYLKTFLRIKAKIYSGYNLISEQGLSLLEPVLYRLPLSNSDDLKDLSLSDNDIDTTSPYTEVQINYLKGSGFTTHADTTLYAAGAVVKDVNGRWYFTPGGGTSGTDNDLSDGSDGSITDWEQYDGEQLIGTTYYAFNRVINLTSGTATAQQIYNWAQRQLRKASGDGTINANNTPSTNQRGFGTVYGNVAADLLEYVGDTLKTKAGVLIRNFDVNDQNSMVFRDVTVDGGGLDSEYVPVTSTERTYPFVSAGSISFSSNLVSEDPDSDTKYAMYFTYITRKTGTDLAITAASGSDATLTSTSTSLAYLTVNDYIDISGFTTAVDNGLWQVTGNISATTADITKLDGATVVNEAAGDTVQIDENPFDSAGAIIVDDNSGTDISDVVSGSSVNFDFDYTNNNQGGRTAGTDAAVTVVAQGLELAEWVSVTATITQATGISITVTANDERNYANPV